MHLWVVMQMLCCAARCLSDGVMSQPDECHVGHAVRLARPSQQHQIKKREEK